MVKRGYIIWLDFEPQTGHEQNGRRSALVISNEVFNNFSNLAIICPITNTLNDHRLKAVGFVAAESRVEAKAS
jgi:mRNA interferase MazF